MASKITRRSLLKAGAGTALGLPILSGCSSRSDGNVPNIILLVVDALRAASLSLYGGGRSTAPFLEGLAGNATLYRKFYTSALWTRPAVTGMLSGLLPLEHRNWRFEKSFPPEIPSFAQALKKFEYHTGFFTANPAIGEKFGMEKHFDFVSFEAARKWEFGAYIVSRFFEWFENLQSGPVCAYVHFWPPHGPYHPPKEHLDRILEQGRPDQGVLEPHQHDVDISLGGSILGRVPWYQGLVNFSTRTEDYLSRYEANVRFADSLLASFFEEYERRHPGRRTVFIITSDHGECLGEHGHFADHGRMLSNSIIHVPLIVYDDGDRQGRVVDLPVSQLDLAGSILQLAGSRERLGRLGRRIFRPGAEPLEANRAILTQEGREVGESGWALTMGDWRLVYNDCPRFGHAHLMQVRYECAAPARRARVALPLPDTALRRPIALAPGVTLESLALHTSYFEAGAHYPFSGRIRLHEAGPGRFLLRLRRPGSAPVPLGRFPCKDAEETLKGSVPPIPADAAGSAPFLTLEGRWSPEGEPLPEGEGWVRLFSFPMLVPQEITDRIHLLGALPVPAAARPGDSVRMKYIWRIKGEPSPDWAVFVHFLDGEDRIAFKNDHFFYQALPAPDFEPERLMRPRKDFDFQDSWLRLDEGFWVSVPEDAPPGRYRIRVGFFDHARTGGGGGIEKYGIIGDPVMAGHIEVTEKAGDVLRHLLDGEAGLAHFRRRSLTAAAARPAGRDRPSPLRRFADRFPGEGEGRFLLSLEEEDDERRAGLLGECLERTPRHRAALEALAGNQGDGAWEESIRTITPLREVDHEFQDLLRVYGFDVARSPVDPAVLYPSIYWEALASRLDCYAAELTVECRAGEDPAVSKRIWWFIGGGVHPTPQWRIGEAVAETVRLTVPAEARSYSFFLSIYPQWDYMYSGQRSRFYLEVRNGDGAPSRVKAFLGSFDAPDLPAAAADPLELKRRDPSFYQLYHLEKDPMEIRNLADREDRVFRKMQSMLLAMLPPLVSGTGTEDESEPSGVKEGGEEGLSRETLQQLQALGYGK